MPQDPDADEDEGPYFGAGQGSYRLGVPSGGRDEPPRGNIRCQGCDCDQGRGYGRDCGRRGQCTNCPEYAVKGDTKCPIHGGSTWNRRVDRRWRLAYSFVGRGQVPGETMSKDKLIRAQEVAKLGAPRKIDPGEALLEEVARAAGHVDYLRRKCEELEESELVWQQVQRTAERQFGDEGAGSFEKETATHAAEIHKWWEMYTKEREHLVNVSTATLRAGVDERRVRIAEKTSVAISSVAEGIAQDLGFDPSDPKVAAIIGARFRELLEVNPDPKDVMVPTVIDGDIIEEAEETAQGPDSPRGEPVPVDF